MRKKIALRIGIAVSMLYAATILFLLYSSHQIADSEKQKSRMIGVRVYADFILDALVQRMNLNDINAATLLGTEQADILEEILLPYSIAEENGNSIQLNMDVVYDNGIEIPYILWSSQLEYKSKLPDYYIEDLTEAMVEVKMQQITQTVMTQGKEPQMGYLVIPAEREEKDLIYIASYRMDEQSVENGFVWNRKMYLIVICGSAFLLLLLFVIGRVLRPIGQLSLAMEQIAAGNYELPDIRFPDNELGNLWMSLHKMCKAVSAQFFAKTNVLRYYYRFAPKGLERLFEKEHLQDVLVGETVMISATVGMLSLVNEEALFRNFLGENYSKNIQQLARLITIENSKNGGIQLNNSSRPDSMKVIYKDQDNNMDKAMQFGITILHTIEAKKEDNGLIQPFLMLYSGQVICGLGGTTEQVYPFVNSIHLECLNTYMDALKGLGIKMVFVGADTERLHGSYTIRMVGRLSIGSEQEILQVYEILDACDKRERLGKKSTQEQFWQALDLFYKNDFYLARNGFNEVLKQYPEDGVAKWYLFLCEDMLNTASAEKIRHDLFPNIMNKK